MSGGGKQIRSILKSDRDGQEESEASKKAKSSKKLHTEGLASRVEIVEGEDGLHKKEITAAAYHVLNPFFRKTQISHKNRKKFDPLVLKTLNRVCELRYESDKITKSEIIVRLLKVIIDLLKQIDDFMNFKPQEKTKKPVNKDQKQKGKQGGGGSTTKDGGQPEDVEDAEDEDDGPPSCFSTCGFEVHFNNTNDKELLVAIWEVIFRHNADCVREKDAARGT